MEALGSNARATAAQTRWRAFCGLAVLVFLLRGVFLISVLPPDEGWDEYQHLGYIEHEVRHGSAPHLFDPIAPDLALALREVPHPPYAVQQLAPLGACDYVRFFSASCPGPATSSSLGLYQAQHPPLYYALVAPLYDALGGARSLLTTVAGLRLLNLGFAATAILLALIALGELATDIRRAYLLALLVVTSPLLLLNAARVANDSLAILLGTACIVALLRPARSRLYTAGVAGMLLGSAIGTKATNLTLLPFVGMFSFCLGWPRLRRALALAAIAIGVSSAIALSWFAARGMGSFAITQEAASEAARSKGFAGYLLAGAAIHWYGLVRGLYFFDTLWVGGWSFLHVPALFYLVHGYVTLACLMALALLLVRRWRRRVLFVPPSTFVASIVVVIGALAGLAAHALQSMSAWGFVTTNTWYAMVALPFWLVIMYQGALALPIRWFRLGLPVALVVTNLWAELYGEFARMLPAYSGGAAGREAWRRIASLHPAWLPPSVGLIALGAALVLLAAAGWLAVRAFLAAERNAPAATDRETVIHDAIPG